MPDKQRVLVIGLCGFPGSWFKAKYRCIRLAKPEKPCKFSSWSIDDEVVKSYATTVVVARSIVKQGFKVEVSIYGLNTLAAPSRQNPDSVKDDHVRRDLFGRD